MLQEFGVREITERKIIMEPNKTNKENTLRVMLIRWDIHPKILAYREELKNQIKEEVIDE